MRLLVWLSLAALALVQTGCLKPVPEGRTYKVMTCAPGAIAVDGQLDDGWKAAVVETNFTSRWDTSIRPGTTFRALMDPDHLYFIFEVEDSTPVCLGSVTNKLQIDGEDRAEIFLAVDPRLGCYYGAEIDPAGRPLDYRAHAPYKIDFSWSFPPDALRIATSKTEKGYIVEGAFSRAWLQSAGIPGLFDGRPMRVGLFRAEYFDGPADDNSRWITWTIPQTKHADFHVPSAFGWFVPATAAVPAGQGQDR